MIMIFKSKDKKDSFPSVKETWCNCSNIVLFAYTKPIITWFTCFSNVKPRVFLALFSLEKVCSPKTSLFSMWLTDTIDNKCKKNRESPWMPLAQWELFLNHFCWYLQTWIYRKKQEKTCSIHYSFYQVMPLKEWLCGEG